MGRDVRQYLRGGLDLRARIDFLGGIERAIDQRPPHRHQGAQHREIVDLLRELLGADQPRARSGELREIRGAAQLLHPRSEEHTSELQSLMRISYAVFCLKKKK